MASTTPQQGSVNNETQAARTVSQQETQSQREARNRDFVSDHSLGRAQGTTAAAAAAAAAAAVANVDRLGLGSGNDGATCRRPFTHDVPATLRGIGSQFQE
ncbi:hypothetical protein CTA2_920 [Colletotrichum tanaceti]|uniref:Uncharacterized protein n=1 Tax=Colletotrichum tanaceti TaxID=1306861 RepID=A0A4U6XW79_9PEZI|nr:hypothetical protein CTA2_920 [Colletotrichum tanaceti]TKW60129.1 hypothetical protein CTA1_4719 [Colletotrichum tanaceti]